MNKVTVFKGTINGREFDTVEAYNAYMNELISKGVTNIQACSSTSIKCVDEEVNSSGYVSSCTADQCPGTCTSVSTSASTELPEEDEDVTFYPYMEDDDPFYLDLLVTDNKETNIDAYNEAQKQLEISYRNIVKALYNSDTTVEERKEYLADVNDIIANVKNDIADTNAAADKINVRRKNLANEFEKYRQNYESAIREMDIQMDILNDASRVTSMFKAFYEDVANETILSIKNKEEDINHNKNHKTPCDCDKIKTVCNEIRPQTVHDLNSLIDKIFGPGWSNYIK